MRHALAVHCPGCNQPIEVLLAVNHGPRWGNTHITLDRPRNHVCQEDPMTAPHSDRDGSEQPIVWPPQQRRDAERRYAEGGLPDLGRVVTEGIEVGRQVFERMPGTTLPRESGTSPATAARAAHASGGEVVEPVRATEAQVQAVEKAWWNGSFNRYGAPRRVTFRAIADAVVAAGPDADEVTRLRADQWKADALAAEAERDRLAETVARVEALAKHTRELLAELPQPHGPWTRGYETAVRDVRAVLPDPSPATTPGGETLGGAEKRCTTCGQGLDTPPCCKTPDGISGHTGGGGRESAEVDR